MKAYIAIGHFKDSKNITSVALTQQTKKAFMQDCYGNEFVPYVVITEAMFQRLSTCNDSMETWELIKKMTSNYRVWENVTEYIEQCFDIMGEKIQQAKEQCNEI